MIYGLLFLIVMVAAIGLTVTIVAEHERAVVFRLGRVIGAKGPGPVIVLRGLDTVRRVTTKLVALDVPIGEIITIDDVAVRVAAVVHLRVVDPVKAVLEVENYRTATAQVAQTVLRSHLGEVSLARVLHQQADVNAAVTLMIAARTEAWGVEVQQVELRTVDVSEAERHHESQPQPEPDHEPAADRGAEGPAEREGDYLSS
ncbi:MAG: slipin family protein [Actinobacteria bacterium]|nr:slipin family protein [Actinomycetota bacterium]